MRMTHETFLEIWRSVEKGITPNNIIGGAERLPLTIFFLQKEKRLIRCQNSLESRRAISYIIYDVTKVII